jgi:hypothetical protein
VLILQIKDLVKRDPENKGLNGLHPFFRQKAKGTAFGCAFAEICFVSTLLVYQIERN